MARKKAKKTQKSYTKIIVSIIVINAIGWVWCSYYLAYLGRYEIAQSLSQTAITTILGTVVTYCLKALVENVNKHGVNLMPASAKNNAPKQNSKVFADNNLNRDY